MKKYNQNSAEIKSINQNCSWLVVTSVKINLSKIPEIPLSKQENEKQTIDKILFFLKLPISISFKINLLLFSAFSILLSFIARLFKMELFILDWIILFFNVFLSNWFNEINPMKIMATPMNLHQAKFSSKIIKLATNVNTTFIALIGWSEEM